MLPTFKENLGKILSIRKILLPCVICCHNKTDKAWHFELVTESRGMYVKEDTTKQKPSQSNLQNKDSIRKPPFFPKIKKKPGYGFNCRNRTLQSPNHKHVNKGKNIGERSSFSVQTAGTGFPPIWQITIQTPSAQQCSLRVSSEKDSCSTPSCQNSKFTRVAAHNVKKSKARFMITDIFSQPPLFSVTKQNQKTTGLLTNRESRKVKLTAGEEAGNSLNPNTFYAYTVLHQEGESMQGLHFLAHKPHSGSKSCDTTFPRRKSRKCCDRPPRNHFRYRSTLWEHCECYQLRSLVEKVCCRIPWQTRSCSHLLASTWTRELTTGDHKWAQGSSGSGYQLSSFTIIHDQLVPEWLHASAIRSEFA